MDNVMRLEEITANAHPALHTYLYDGWVLRFSNGYTNRANSVLQLYPHSLPLEEKIAFCRNGITKTKCPVFLR